MITVVCICKKRKETNGATETMDETHIYDKSSASLNDDFDKDSIKLTFMTTAQDKVEVTINKKKSTKELTNLFFKKINRMDLIGDKYILFVWDAKTIGNDSKDLVKLHINCYSGNIIMVNDPEEKIGIITQK